MKQKKKKKKEKKKEYLEDVKTIVYWESLQYK